MGCVTIYGIKNCDTMKKARAWLEEHGVDYAFHDYKASGIDREHLQAWIKAAGWETVLNRAGTTFRKLPEADREGLNEAKAIKLMLAQSSMIKRPVLETGKGGPLVGFKPEIYLYGAIWLSFNSPSPPTPLTRAREASGLAGASG